MITELPETFRIQARRGFHSVSYFTNPDRCQDKGKLSIVIKPENFKGESIQLSKEITLNAGYAGKIELNTSTFSQLLISHPHLVVADSSWLAGSLPAGGGICHPAGVTDKSTVAFGIRRPVSFKNH